MTDNNGKVRWGILSTARINRRLIPEMHASANGELLAVASRSQETADKYGTEWEIPRRYGSYEALLVDKDIDVVYISLPNDLHAEWTIRALEAGKHVLCEKPLCLSFEELKQIGLAVERSGRKVMEAFMYVHHPQTQLFRDIVKGGDLGEIVSMQSEFAATFNRELTNYRMDPTKGGGALWDIGVYPVSFFLGLVQSGVVNVEGKARVEHGIDMSFWGRLDFESGVTGQFFSSFESEYSTRTSILGSKGRLDITHPFNAAHECRAWTTISGEVNELTLPEVSLYACEIEHMHDAVLEDADLAFTLDHSEAILETILRLRISAGLS